MAEHKRALPRTRKEFEYRMQEVRQDGIIEGARNAQDMFKRGVDEREKRVRDMEAQVVRDAIQAMSEMGKALAQHAEVLGRTVMHTIKRQDR